MSSRDDAICDRYRKGASLTELSAEFCVTKGRIRQILFEHRVSLRPGLTAKTDRAKFLGVNISTPVKNALKQEAARRGISMSALTSDVLKTLLIDLGYTVEASQIK